MLLQGINYFTEHIFPYTVAIPNSFVEGFNHIGTKHGETKIKMGSKKEVHDFFKFGEDSRSNPRCFLLRKDLLEYLDNAEDEFHNPSQDYSGRRRMNAMWDIKRREVEAMPEVCWFEVQECGGQGLNAGYLRSQQACYHQLRFLVLPNFTTLRVMHLVSPLGPEIYYWKVFADFDALASLRLSQSSRAEAAAKMKESPFLMAKSSYGQFRDALSREFKCCPVTGLTDQSILEATHVKSRALCRASERLDPANGLVLSPTLTRCFRKGLISFSDQGNLLISDWMSEQDRETLQLQDGQPCSLPLSDRRKDYLAWHRRLVFKGKLG